jgi:hypothetical protein
LSATVDPKPLTRFITPIGLGDKVLKLKRNRCAGFSIKPFLKRFSVKPFLKTAVTRKLRAQRRNSGESVLLYELKM